MSNANRMTSAQLKNKTHEGDVTAKPGVVYEYEKITGSLNAEGADAKTAFPNLTTVGGYLNAAGADAKTAFPNLTTVGGYLNAEGADTKNVRTNVADARKICRRNIFQANLEIGYYFADGILARLVARKGYVAHVVICGKTEISYVVDDGNGKYSHGSTLKEARDGLIYKLSSRDTTPFKSWTKKTVIPIADAIKAYISITGACSVGTRHFCEQNGNLPEKLTVGEAIQRTKGQYGNDTFAKFFAA